MREINQLGQQQSYSEDLVLPYSFEEQPGISPSLPKTQDIHRERNSVGIKCGKVIAPAVPVVLRNCSFWTYVCL